ncbi:MAG: hypothetical protein UY48_C0013G0025 [Candidatus Gottesmanbacteria bacterium GW2011_GWB1_49_7]|uniref:Uncharacterized protein n=1 Tax=Candidatus Gottesmanbacteria bacterium GW2011_GWB1_49_7 TaxID=1618448 RepID=A0A0G1YZE0_9BACT|nr:MAG: hypothetical protein UY48_C0013G0025 [Candidatus Gottesmanbacteria bacterium GW2011_GWB1_49_7]
MGVVDELKNLNAILYALRQSFEKLDTKEMVKTLDRYEKVAAKFIEVLELNTAAIEANTAELKKTKR